MAVADYVENIVAAVLREPHEHRELYVLCPQSIWAERKLKAWKLEEEAVEFAQAGNPDALAALLRNDHPLNDKSLNVAPWDREDWHPAVIPSFLPAGTIRSTLSPQTWELIADILDGTWKRPPYRAPATPDQRRKMTPIHDAADWVPMIEAILRRAYPKQEGDHIHQQAIFCAARRYGIENNTEKLRRHVDDRSKKDRHRLQNP